MTTLLIISGSLSFVCIVLLYSYHFFYRNFAYRNLLTGDNYTPLTRMNVISVVLKSARDRLYTGDTHRQFPKDKTAIKYFCGVGN